MSFRSMAINSSHHDENCQVQASPISYPKGSDLNLALSAFTKQGIIGEASGSSKEWNSQAKNNSKTAYLASDRMQLLSYHTKEKDDKKILSSFQLAANIYKSNSDEFKLKKLRKSNKKSVLTLPNQPQVLPQSCTVSDMNDSEYFNPNDNQKARKLRKRFPIQRKQRKYSPGKDYEYYDKEAKYCSQMNVYLDCSSTDVVKNFKGDSRKKPRSCDSETNSDVAPHNVWAVLRDINRFEFHPSPPMSDDSIKLKKKKLGKKKIQRGIYETCQTEQIAYISSIELNMKSPRDHGLSGSSSEDRMTVINNEDSFSICERVQTTFKNNVKQIKSKNKREKLRKQIKTCNGKSSDINNCKDPCSPNQLVEFETNVTRIRAKTDAVEHSGMTVKNDASIETLVQKKSGTSMKCFERDKQVEMQTGQDLKQQGETKPGVNPKTTNGNNTTEARNAIRKQNVKIPLRGPLLPPRVPWRNSRLRSPLTTDSEPNKMILNPAKGSTTSKMEQNPITLPQAATVTNINPRHPMTRSDILRTISKIKFPVVILGKDQVSGTIKIEEYDSPQFNGLDKHVWPFMQEWSDETSKLNEPDRRKYRNLAGRRDCNECKPKINGPSVNIPNNQLSREKKYFSTDSNRLPQNNNDYVSNKNRESKQKGGGKLKPILQFRDRMLKLLYKNTSKPDIADNGSLICTQDGMKTVIPLQIKDKLLKDDRIDSQIGNVSISKTPPVSRLPVRIINPQSSAPSTSPPNIQITQKRLQTKQSWSKTKWASDFVENVIRKIKSGIYYNDEMVWKSSKIEPLRNRTNNTNRFNLQDNDAKEVPIQPEKPINSADLTPKITIQKKKEPPVMLPGFDDVSQQLEIESMTRNQIAVKHCVMNIVLQFDVNVPLDSDQQWNTFKRSTSCISVSVADGKTKMYKCKARILNALLPAEICSIIPIVMKQFLDKDKHPAVILHEENRTSAISHVPEFTVPEIQGTNTFPVLPSTLMSSIIKSELTSLKDGTFSKNRKRWSGKSEPYANLDVIAVNDFPYEWHSVEALLLQRPKLNCQDYLKARPHPLITHSTKQKSALTSVSRVGNFGPLTENVCRDLVPYTRNDMMYGVLTKTESAPQMMFKEFFRMMNCVLDYSPSLPLIKVQTDRDNICLDFSIRTHQGIGASVCINVKNLQLNPLYNNTMTYSPTAVVNACYEKRIEYIKLVEDKEFKSKPRGKLPNIVISKPKMKGSTRYVKLYKKCKSTSHISSEKNSTPLSKVTNLDEFFQAMCSSKLLSSVFDGYCGKKTLSCVSAMKNWITEITPRQALLVMLLTNKKDTPNLMRFRPILLQGIAVNRITRVSELDMEIEVIERETFNKLSELPGIPSTKENMQNNDYLFQELYWIAKTTASDYQRRFDETSENLLRALLEKRKKLKPSYLRVMARYVGLGLLKHPQTIN